MDQEPRPLHDPKAVARARRRMLPISTQAVLRPLSDALCDPVRFKIVLALSDASLTVKDLAHVIGRSQSTTSQHLRVLREIQAVDACRRGRQVSYSLARGGIGPPLLQLV